ncbi:MAG TPA: hypothetical protein VD866_08145 [Urbifossiella sp.]|nr:hypothetical protein [Urbifossiella sp.]
MAEPNTEPAPPFDIPTLTRHVCGAAVISSKHEPVGRVATVSWSSQAGFVLHLEGEPRHTSTGPNSGPGQALRT